MLTRSACAPKCSALLLLWDVRDWAVRHTMQGFLFYIYICFKWQRTKQKWLMTTLGPKLSSILQQNWLTDLNINKTDWLTVWLWLVWSVFSFWMSVIKDVDDIISLHSCVCYGEFSLLLLLAFPVCAVFLWMVDCLILRIGVYCTCISLFVTWNTWWRS